MSLPERSQLGPYEIVAPLGAGGMGEVYRARDARLDRDVAIKVLPDRIANDPAMSLRFEREAKLIAALSHPNILAVYDVGREGGHAYLVTELLEGRTLRAALIEERLPTRKALEIGAAVADGLAAAHARNIVHRDLKPENIFLTNDGVVKILDFGLARMDSDLPAAASASHTPTVTLNTSPGTILGTINYMSPEQIRAQKTDGRSDIFSFGCVLFEMLTGERAFQGETTADTMTSILREAPKSVRSSSRTVGPEIERLIDRCLEKKPEARFQSSQDLSFALRTVLADSASRIMVGPQKTSRKWLAIAAIAATAIFVPGYFILRNEPRSHRIEPATATHLLAVLPFVNDSGDPELDYLSDGIAETLINGFSRIDSLNTVPRSTAFRHKGKDVDPLQAGRHLGATAVLSGRVLKRGENLTVQVELVDVEARRQLWGDRYQRRIADLVEIERNISKEITETLRLRLTGEEQESLSRGYTQNAEAYRHYLHGRSWWAKRTREGFDHALEMFREAVRLDPSFALAYTGLADCYSLLPLYGWMTPKEAEAQGRAAALRALELDDGLAEAHTSMGMVWFYLNWEFDKAIEEFRRAEQLNPRYATTQQWWGLCVGARGQLAEAKRRLRRSIDLDPLMPIFTHNLAWVQLWEHDWSSAKATGESGLEFAPEFFLFRQIIGLAQAELGNSEEAIAALRIARDMAGDVSFANAYLAYVLGRSGNKEECRTILKEWLKLGESRYVPPTDFAIMYVGLGDLDSALEWLETGYEERDEWMTFLAVLPFWDPLRDDPRFVALLHRMGLPNLKAEVQPVDSSNH